MNEELINYINNMFEQKGFDEFTKSKLFDYIETHDKLYGHIIDTKEVVDRISNNLNHNIQISDKADPLSRGAYDSMHKKIEVTNPQFGDDEYFHEIDHCATSDLSMMPDYDAPDAWEIKAIDERANNGYKYSVGIETIGRIPKGAEYINYKFENEGITALKQRDYAKLKDIPESRNGYDDNYKVAEQFAYIIGKDNLLEKHFHNDVDGIRDEFSKYGISFDEVSDLLKSPDFMSIEFFESIRNQIKIDEKKQKCQDLLARGFISKRCHELGINDEQEYFRKLNRKQKQVELQELEQFEQFKIGDSTVLEYIKDELQPKSLIQTIKRFWENMRRKKLPEKTFDYEQQEISDEIPFDESEIYESEIEENKIYENETEIEESQIEENETKKNNETKSWDLSNWGIDKEQFNEQSIQKINDSQNQQEDFEHTDPEINDAEERDD